MSKLNNRKDHSEIINSLEHKLHKNILHVLIQLTNDCPLTNSCSKLAEEVSEKELSKPNFIWYGQRYSQYRTSNKQFISKAFIRNKDDYGRISSGRVHSSKCISSPHSTMVKSSLPKNVVFSAHVHMHNAAYISSIMWNSISG